MEIVGYNFAQKHVMKNVARADRLGYVINSSQKIMSKLI